MNLTLTVEQIGFINAVVAFSAREMMETISTIAANSKLQKAFAALGAAGIDVYFSDSPIPGFPDAKNRSVFIRFGNFDFEIPLGLVEKPERNPENPGPNGPSGGTPGAGVVEKEAKAA